MKKTSFLLFSLFLCLTLIGCESNSLFSSKSDSVVAVENAINAIGEVSMDSLEAIENAEKLFNILTESEKEKVDNRLLLSDAREKYENILKENIFNNAGKAFHELSNVADLCISGMDDIYGAWYFGIYEADEYSSSSVLTYLSFETSFSEKELSKACSDAGLTPSLCTYDWNYCLYTVQQAHTNKGTYDSIHSKLKDVDEILKEIGNKYSDYEYYPTLKAYYSKVSSYADFFENTTGSFKQLADTINDYENSIRTYQSDLKFIFE